MSSSKSCHSFLSVAAGYLIPFPSILGVRRVPGESWASAWRNWTLWWAFRPCTSCISPGGIPVCCVWLDSTWHFIWAWFIFNPCIFWHFFPHRHIVIMVRGCKAWFVSDWSVQMGISFSPPLGLPSGCSLIFLSIALFWHPHIGLPTLICFLLWSLLTVHCLSNLTSSLFPTSQPVSSQLSLFCR